MLGHNSMAAGVLEGLTKGVQYCYVAKKLQCLTVF
jgi:hypothetical protein